MIIFSSFSLSLLLMILFYTWVLTTILDSTFTFLSFIRCISSAFALQQPRKIGSSSQSLKVSTPQFPSTTSQPSQNIPQMSGNIFTDTCMTMRFTCLALLLSLLLSHMIALCSNTFCHPTTGSWTFLGSVFEESSFSVAIPAPQTMVLTLKVTAFIVAAI